MGLLGARLFRKKSLTDVIRFTFEGMRKTGQNLTVMIKVPDRGLYGHFDPFS